jgi:hypothetical protein
MYFVFCRLLLNPFYACFRPVTSTTGEAYSKGRKFCQSLVPMEQDDSEAETEMATESICRCWILDSTLNALFICKVYNLAGFK